MRPGRIFVLSLEPGEIINDTIEAFASEHGILYGAVSLAGGVDGGSVLTVGPKIPIGEKITPQTKTLEAPCEATGFGTIFPNEDGVPKVHMHGSAGRDGKSATGCFRKGMVAWLVTEVIVTEYVGTGPVRKKDAATGFELLTVE